MELADPTGYGRIVRDEAGVTRGVRTEGGEVVGYNVYVGGGLGTTHGDGRTYARAASVLGYVPRGQQIDVAKAVLGL